MPDVKTRDGIVLHYDLHDFTDPWSNAPVIILQHGYARSGRFWYSFIPHLARFYKVICPDLRGMGRSSKDFDLAKGISLETFLSDLGEIIDSLGVDSVHYAGESFGGMMGFIYAAEHPTRIRTLCTFAAPMYISEWLQQTYAFGHESWEVALRKMGAIEWARAGNSATRFPPDTDPGLLEWYAAEMAQSGEDAMVAMSRVAAKIDVRPFLSKVKAPVLGIFPTSGSITTNDHEQALRDHVADATVVHLHTKYHMIQVIKPAECAKSLLSFVAMHDGRVCYE